MKSFNTIIASLALFGLIGCSTTTASRNGEKGSAQAAQRLLTDDQNALAAADAEYKDSILKHGEGSDQAVKAKTAFDNARNKYIADQQHVAQWRRVQAEQPNPVEAATQPATPATTAGASGTTANPSK
jgi:hypothetical protein